MSASHLFVYGTLRRFLAGRAAKELLQQATLLGPAQMPGRLYLVGEHYPGLVPEGDGQVIGELYRLPEAMSLEELDEYEGCSAGDSEPHEFVRTMGEAALPGGERVQTWYYRYNLPVQDNQRIPSGDFSLSLQEKK